MCLRRYRKAGELMKAKFIEREQGIVAYFPDTLKFFEVNKKTEGIIKAIEDNMESQQIKTIYGISDKELQSVENQIRFIRKEVPSAEEKNNKDNTKRLSKLVLNISNACNLRCKYCYANGGNYQSNEGMMSKEVAKKALDLFYSKYENIYMIQIFGGEPMLNFPLIQYICEYVSINKKGSKIGIVTNGTFMNMEFISLVKKYNMQVTVSYDGTPLVNDMMRVTKKGQGTSNLIIENIKMLKKHTDQPSTIEVTYNQNHVNNRVSIGDVIRFIRNEIGTVPLHIVPAGGEKNCSYVLENRKAFVEAIDEIFRNSLNMELYTFSLAQRIVLSLYTKRTGKYLCEAGLSTYSVSINGDVYPCFMFTDDETLCMGNIFDQGFFESERFRTEVKQLFHYNKETIDECKECFIKKSCNGCLGINLLETGNVFNVSKETCDMYRQMTEQVIYNLYLKKKERDENELAG